MARTRGRFDFEVEVDESRQRVIEERGVLLGCRVVDEEAYEFGAGAVIHDVGFL